MPGAVAGFARLCATCRSAGPVLARVTPSPRSQLIHTSHPKAVTQRGATSFVLAVAATGNASSAVGCEPKWRPSRGVTLNCRRVTCIRRTNSGLLLNRLSHVLGPRKGAARAWGNADFRGIAGNRGTAHERDCPSTPDNLHRSLSQDDARRLWGTNGGHNNRTSKPMPSGIKSRLVNLGGWWWLPGHNPTPFSIGHLVELPACFPPCCAPPRSSKFQEC